MTAGTAPVTGFHQRRLKIEELEPPTTKHSIEPQ